MTKTKDRIVESRSMWAGLGALVIGAGFLLFVSMASVDNQYVTIWLGFVGLYLTNVIGKQKSMKAGEEFQAKMEKALNDDMDDKIRTIIREELARSQNGNDEDFPSETS